MLWNKSCVGDEAESQRAKDDEEEGKRERHHKAVCHRCVKREKNRN